MLFVKIATYFPVPHHVMMFRAIPKKKYLGGEDGRRYIFLWVVGAESFQIIWVVGVRPNLITWVVGVSPNLITWVVGIYSFAKLKKMAFTCHWTIKL